MRAKRLLVLATVGALVAAMLGWSAGPVAAGLGERVEFITKWGSAGAASGQFESPFAIAVDQVGNVYVADTFNDRVQKFTPAGGFITQWGTSGNGAGEFDSPAGIHVDAAGDVWVADTGNHRLQKFTPNGTYLSGFGLVGAGDGKFTFPYGLDFDSAGNIYVADTGNNRVQKFDSAGVFLDKWGTSGSGDGEFSTPHDVAVGAGDTVYVADSTNNRIQMFTTDGDFIGAFGAGGTNVGFFQGVWGIDADDAGNIYVVEFAGSRVQKLSPAGAPLTAWGTDGTGNGQFLVPRGIAVDRTGNVYVLEDVGDRVQRFWHRSSSVTRIGVGTSKPGKEIEVSDRSGKAGIRFRDTGATKTVFDLTMGADELRVIDVIAGTVPVRIRKGAPSNTLVVDSTGRVGVNRAFPNEALHVVGNIYASGSITPGSDEAAKTGFEPVQPDAVLEALSELEISSWSYRHDPPTVRHLGPTAGDFAAAFGLGDGTGAGIATVDADGVALTAIQALTARVAELEAELASLRKALDGG